jgi:DNA-binding IclR family transcriptional regulator
MGGAARSRSKLYSFAKPAVDELAEETGELAMLTVENGGRPIYLYQSWGNRAITTDSHVGIQLPLHCTATGKATLAQLQQSRVKEIIEEHPLPQETPNTITDPEMLFNELDTIREDGIAFDDEERISGMRGIAVPITVSGESETIGAIGVTGPVSRLTDHVFRDEIPSLIVSLARMIEVDATYS